MANLSNINNKFIVEDSGDVGIGVTTATTKLHIGGTAPGDSIIRQDSTVSGTNWEIGERAAGKWQIFEDDGDTIVATFMSTGNVGIGTDSPAQKLHIKSTTSGPTGIIIENTNNAQSLDLDFWNNAGAVQGRIRYNEGGGTFSFFPNASVTSAMEILYNGNVGIGVTSPTEKLDVVGTGGNTNIRVYDSSGNSEVGIKLQGDAKTWTLQNWGSGGDNLRLLNNAGNTVQLWDDNGKVAIGNFNDPDRTLDVRGDGMSIYGTGGYTELMLRGQVEGTGTVRNVGAFHLSIRSDVGGDNDDLKFLRFVNGTYGGIAMQIQNTTGNVQIGASSVTNLSLGSSGSDFVLSAKKDGTDAINMVFKTQASGGTLAERMRISSNGRTLITVASGNTIQDTTLQLKATGASDNAGIMFINTGNTSSFNDIAGIASFVESGSAKGNLQFWTRNTDGANTDVATRMHIDSVGLATFRSTYIVAGLYGGEVTLGGASTTFGLQLKYSQEAATTSTIYHSPGYTSNDNLFKLGSGSGNSNQLVLRGNGNVGIGTNSPGDAKLYVNGGTTLGGNTSDAGATRIFGDIKRPQANYFVRRNYNLTAGSSGSLYNIARQWHDHANWGLGHINVIMWGIYYGKNNFNKADFSCRYGYSGGAADVVANFNPGNIAIPAWTAATQVSGNTHYRDLQIQIPAYWQISFEIISPGSVQTYNVNNTAGNTVYLYPH